MKKKMKNLLRLFLSIFCWLEVVIHASIVKSTPAMCDMPYVCTRGSRPACTPSTETHLASPSHLETHSLENLSPSMQGQSLHTERIIKSASLFCCTLFLVFLLNNGNNHLSSKLVVLCYTNSRVQG